MTTMSGSRTLEFTYSLVSRRCELRRNVETVLTEFPYWKRFVTVEGTLCLNTTELGQVVARFVPMGYTIHIEQQ